MRNLAASLSLAAFLAAAPARSAPPAAVDVAVKADKYVLANGLEVVLHEDHRTPVVAVNLWYHVGSKDEPPGKNGFAHLFEHLMFQGSKHVGEDQFFKYLERAGASERNGTTNTDRTNYYETVPASELPLVLWLESDRMGFLLDHVDQKTFESQREVVKNERRQNYENAPYGLVRKFVAEALYPEAHPYRRLTIGTPEDLDAARLEDARTFFKTFYTPSNATLVIAGDFDPAAARGLVERYFAPLARADKPRTVRTPAPVTLDGERRLAVEAEVELPRVGMAWPSPPHFEPGDAELDFAAAILAHGKSSRLYRRLVHDLEIAQDVAVHQSSGLLGSTFDITVTLKKDKPMDKAIAVVDEELAKLRATPPTAAEVERVRSDTLAKLVFPLEQIGQRADLLNHYNDKLGAPDGFARDAARYGKITPEDVRATLERHVPPGKRVLYTVIPTKGAPRAGRLVAGGAK